jgi:hypothetical protein
VKNIIILCISFVLIVGFVSTSTAVPELNIANDGFEDRTDGSVYDHYQNSGDLLFTSPGNNLGNETTLANVQSMVRTAVGDPGLILTITDSVAFTLWDSNGYSGTWNTVPPLGPTGTIDFYAVKAGDYFAMYQVDPAETSGSWSTFDIWNIGGSGTGGHPSNGGGGVGISHFTAYNPGISVPEPNVALMIGSSLLGLALFGGKG